MIRPYINSVLVEKQEAPKVVGAFTFDVDESYHKGKVVAVGKPLVSAFGTTEFDVKEGEVIIYKGKSVGYSCVGDGKTLEIVNNGDIIAVEI